MLGRVGLIWSYSKCGQLTGCQVHTFVWSALEVYFAMVWLGLAWAVRAWRGVSGWGVVLSGHGVGWLGGMLAWRGVSGHGVVSLQATLTDSKPLGTGMTDPMGTG